MPSLKPLKSVAHNVIHQFASTLNYWSGDYGINHLANAALGSGGVVVVNLLARSSQPMLSDDGHFAIGQLADLLPALLVKEGFDCELLSSASARFSFHRPAPTRGGNAAYDCLVQFTTTEGRHYEVKLTELNAP